MTEKTKSQKVNHANSLKWYIVIFIGVIIIFIIGAWVNIKLLNKQFDKNEKWLSNSKQSTNPLANVRVDSTKIYALKEEDLQKFNDHIDYLTDKVEGEVKRTQENNQYDIDRVNTFLAIGIGLLAIIGGLLPIFVNFFSKEHLEKRLEDIQEQSKDISTTAAEAKGISDKALKKAELAEKEAEKATKSADNIEKTIRQLGIDLEPIQKEVENVKEATKKIPYIDLLVFQNAVAKLTSSDALKLFIGANRYIEVAAYLRNLVSAIDSFKETVFEDNPNFDVAYFVNITTELKLTLRLGPIRRIPDSRSFQEKIDEAVAQLAKFEIIELKEYQTQLKVVSGIIAELETLVINKNK